MVGGVVLAMCVLRRLRTLGPLIIPPHRRGRLDLGATRRMGPRLARVVSDNQLRAPLSNRPCVYWQSLRVGPGIHTQEKAGAEIGRR
jgi:hypothetical protein